MAVQPSRATASLVLATPKGAAKPDAVDPSREEPDVPIAQTVIPREASEDAVAAVSIAGAPTRRGTISLNLRLDPDLHKRLRDMAHQRDVSIQSLVDGSIRAMLKRMAP